MKNILYKHYKKVHSSSTDQFKNDFGCYPPKPLNCVNPKTTFNIIFLSRFGWAINLIVMTLRLMSSDESRKAGVFKGNPDIANIVQSLKNAKVSFSTLITEFKKNNNFKKLLLAIFVILAFFPVALVVLPYIIFRCLKIFIYVTVINNKNLGSFIPVLNDEYEILITDFIDCKLKEAVISHEHLHLVQYVSSLNAGFEKIEKSCLNSPQDYLSENDTVDRHIIYLFEVNEVEARLHEVTLSYYRNFGSLPITVGGFLDMLVSSQELYEFLREVFGDSFHLFDKNGIGRNFYSLRDNNSLIGLQCLILCLKGNELRKRFITEVLPVMYGNLLGYYGDCQREAEFLAQIERPNLYDRFYGTGDLSLFQEG